MTGSSTRWEAFSKSPNDFCARRRDGRRRPVLRPCSKCRLPQQGAQATVAELGGKFVTSGAKAGAFLPSKLPIFFTWQRAGAGRPQAKRTRSAGFLACGPQGARTSFMSFLGMSL